jgi:hypothetical protein
MIETIQKFVFEYQDFFIVVPLFIVIIIESFIPEDEWRDI